MIQNYPNHRFYPAREQKNKKNKKNVMGKIQKKFVKFANYSGLIRSKFGQPNNSAFGSASQKKLINWV